MAYKQPSTGPFKMMGSSPAKKATDPKAIKGKHYPDKATVQKLKTGPYAKGGQNAQTTAPKGFNTKGGKTTTPGYSTTKAAKNKGVKAKTNMKIDFNYENKRAQGQKLAKVTKKPTSTLSRVTKALGTTPSQLARRGKEVLKTTNRNLISGGKQILKKSAKFLGGKTLGVAGMMMATSSKADQPTKGKGKREYKGGKIDFTKKK